MMIDNNQDRLSSDPASGRDSWWRFWMAGGLLFAGFEIIGNAIIGRFPVLFTLLPGSPFWAISLNSVTYIALILAVCLSIGLIAELIRKIFRAELSFHLAVATALIFATAVYLGYGIVFSDLDKVDPSTGLPEDYEIYSPLSQWWWGIGVVAGSALIWVVYMVRIFRNQEKAGPRLAVLVLSLVLFNISDHILDIDVSRIWPAVIISATALSVCVIPKLIRIRLSKIITVVISIALAVVLFQGVYFGWPGKKYDRHLILMIWDAMPALRLGVYGHDIPNTPTLNTMREHMVLFEQAYSPTNYTFPSHVSIFTGRYLREHHLYDGTLDDMALYSTFPNMAAAMSAKGYRPLLLTENAWVMPISNGFDSSFCYPTRFRGVEYFLPFYRDTFLIRQIIDHVRFNYEGIFKWTVLRIEKRQLTDWLLRARREGPYFIFTNWMYFHSRHYPSALKSISINETPEHGYDASIRFMDDYLKYWLSMFHRADQLSDSIFILTADHGDFTGEFGMYEHSKTLLEPVLHVPLILFGKSVTSETVSRPVPLVALKSAIEELTPDSPGAGWNIRTFIAAMLRNRGMVAEREYDFKGEGETLRWFLAAWDGKMKYIQDDYREIPGHSEGLDMDSFYFLYDLESDPGELENLAGARPSEVDRMKGLISEWESRIKPAPLHIMKWGEEAEYPDGLVEQLRTLGYVR